jgi:hypothetical protein
MLTGLILDSYTNAQVKVVTLNGAINPIQIKPGVKQGCPLSPILFDICIDPLIEKLSQTNLRNLDIGGQRKMELLIKLMLTIFIFLLIPTNTC